MQLVRRMAGVGMIVFVLGTLASVVVHAIGAPVWVFWFVATPLWAWAYWELAVRGRGLRLRRFGRNRPLT